MLTVRQTLICTLSLVVALLFSLNARADELTINGNFETGDTSGWTSFATGTQTFGVTNDAFAGSFAGVLFNMTDGTALVIKQANLGVGNVIPGEMITISFAAKGAGVLGGVAFAEFFSEISGGGTSSTQILGGGPLALTNTYQVFNFTTLAGPIVTGGVTLQFNAATGANPGSTSRLFIDNASVSVVRAVPEPASAALLGLAGFGMMLRRRRKFGR